MRRIRSHSKEGYIFVQRRQKQYNKQFQSTSLCGEVLANVY